MMTSSPEAISSRRVRSRRSAGPVVAVTGAAHGVGRLLAGALAARADVGAVVAVDDARGDLRSGTARVTWRVLDMTDPSLLRALNGVDVVVHLPPESSPAVRSTQTVLTAAAASRVRRVVLCTSATVYGAEADDAVPLPEDTPVRSTDSASSAGSVVAEHLEVERLAELAPRAHPGLGVTVLRPAAVVGAGMESAVIRHFQAPRLLVVRGSHPRWQFCAVEDLVSALELAALGDVEGVLTVGCEGWLEQEDVEQITGMRRVELPAGLAFGTAERLHRLGMVATPASDLHYLAHPWVVPSTRLRAAGWTPTCDNASVLRRLMEQLAEQSAHARRIGRKEGTLGAAGAAVAVVGTAALVRRARKRRGG